MSNDALSRPVVINCCKDRTLTFMRRGQRPFNDVALPVFTVNTIREAETLITLVGICQYEQHPLLPGQPWLKIDIDLKRHLEIDDLPKVTAKLEQAYAAVRKWV
jgi:hypothetical protein